MFTRTRTVQLRGRAYEPSRSRSLTAHPLVVRICDWHRGRRLGTALAYGQDVTDDDGRLHVDKEIDAQTQRAIAAQTRTYERAVDATQQAREDAGETRRQAQQQVGALREEEQKLKRKEEALGDRDGPTKARLGATLFGLFLLTMPIDVGAAQMLPLTEAMQTLFVITLGGGMVFSAETASKRIDALGEAHAKRETDAFGFAQERAFLTVALGLPIAVIGGTTLWRAETFGAAAEASGEIVPAGPANLAFALIALMAFGVAVLVGIAYRKVKPLRDVRRARSRNQSALGAWETRAGNATTIGSQADIRADALATRREQTLTALRHWGEERKARIRQHAAIVEARVRRRRKLGNPSRDKLPT